MPRPKVPRRISFNPNVTYFKPRGVPLHAIDEIELSHDELEALRLKDYMGLDQKIAAEKMNVSQPTFHRILNSARKKIATAIVDGKAISIRKTKQA